MFESNILSGEAIAYQPTGNESEILVSQHGNHVWHKVQAVCWHHPEEGEEEGAQLIGYWVVGGGLRRVSVVVFGR